MTGAGVQRCTGAWVLGARVLALLLLASGATNAQDAQQARVMTAVRAAVTPALPFPASDESGALPANGNTDALWMVRPMQPDDQSIEIVANPLNDVNQLRATRAMAQIEHNIEAAQRRATAQYDRAVAEAKRTGRSQEVDGVTLSDEGVAGAKIDADSHVAIEVFFNRPTYLFALASGIAPSPSTEAEIAGAVAVLALPSNVFRDEKLNTEHYSEAQRLVFLGRVTPPQVNKRGENVFEVSAAATASDHAAIANLVVRLRGNEALVAEVLRKTDWGSLLELLK